MENIVKHPFLVGMNENVLNLITIVNEYDDVNMSEHHPRENSQKEGLHPIFEKHPLHWQKHVE